MVAVFVTDFLAVTCREWTGLRMKHPNRLNNLRRYRLSANSSAYCPPAKAENDIQPKIEPAIGGFPLFKFQSVSHAGGTSHPPKVSDKARCRRQYAVVRRGDATQYETFGGWLYRHQHPFAAGRITLSCDLFVPRYEAQQHVTKIGHIGQKRS